MCRGCKRFHHEVINWNGYNDDEKRAVWTRLEVLLVQVMTAKVEVFDELRLRSQLEQRQIRFVPQQSPYCWAYQLIARGARMIDQLDAYGMVLLPEFRNWTLPELRDAIDREFFLLSEAHYERYIAPKFLVKAWSCGSSPVFRRACRSLKKRHVRPGNCALALGDEFFKVVDDIVRFEHQHVASRESSTISAVLPISAPESPVRGHGANHRDSGVELAGDLRNHYVGQGLRAHAGARH